MSVGQKLSCYCRVIGRMSLSDRLGYQVYPDVVGESGVTHTLNVYADALCQLALAPNERWIYGEVWVG